MAKLLTLSTPAQPSKLTVSAFQIVLQPQEVFGFTWFSTVILQILIWSSLLWEIVI